MSHNCIENKVLRNRLLRHKCAREIERLASCRETQHFGDSRVVGFGGLPLAGRWWYDDRMLKIRMKRDAEQNAAAMKRLTQIETSIIELPNEDLLDLADIFREKSETAIAHYAFAEMARRKISL